MKCREIYNHSLAASRCVLKTPHTLFNVFTQTVSDIFRKSRAMNKIWMKNNRDHWHIELLFAPSYSSSSFLFPSLPTSSPLFPFLPSFLSFLKTPICFLFKFVPSVVLMYLLYYFHFSYIFHSSFSSHAVPFLTKTKGLKVRKARRKRQRVI